MDQVTDLERRGVTFLDWDPGSVRHLWVLRGPEGAVHFAYADWLPDAADELRVIDTKFLIRFGHPLMPMGLDVGYHARAPMHQFHLDLGPADEHCEWLDDQPCWADGSGLRGRELMQAWLAHDRDLDWLYEQLAVYYARVFRSDGDGPLEFAEMIGTLLGLAAHDDEGADD